MAKKKAKQKIIREIVHDEIKFLCTCGEYVTFPQQDELSEDIPFVKTVDRFCPNCGKIWRLYLQIDEI